jgi:hypothetical protein
VSALHPAGRQDPKVVLLLAVVLLLCLGAVAGSWLWTHRAPSSSPRQDYASLAESLGQDADFLMTAIENRLRREEPALDLKRLAAHRLAPVVAAAATPRATAAAPSAEVELHLQGIAWHPSRPVAFIDGRAFERGESVGGFQVLEITARSVTLQDALGHKRVLSLAEE